MWHIIVPTNYTLYTEKENSLGRQYAHTFILLICYILSLFNCTKELDWQHLRICFATGNKWRKCPCLNFPVNKYLHLFYPHKDLCFSTLTYTSHAHTHSIVLDRSHTSIKLLLTGGTKRGCNPILLLHVLQSQAPHEVHVSLWHETYHKQRLRFIGAAGNLPRLLQWLHRERWREEKTLVPHGAMSHTHWSLKVMITCLSVHHDTLIIIQKY